jgi:hypothetical protein
MGARGLVWLASGGTPLRRAQASRIFRRWILVDEGAHGFDG